VSLLTTPLTHSYFTEDAVGGVGGFISTRQSSALVNNELIENVELSQIENAEQLIDEFEYREYEIILEDEEENERDNEVVDQNVE